MKTNNDEKLIRETINQYFIGTYQSDAALLKDAFHPDCHIVGSLDGKIYDWNLNDFIARVTKLPSPAMSNEKYDKEILSLDRVNDIAIVKARVLVGPYTFTDYVTLLKADGKWSIRHKSFSS